MAWTVPDILIELGQLCGARGELDEETRFNLTKALQYALQLIDTYRTWKWQAKTATFVTADATAEYNLLTVNDNAMKDMGQLVAIFMTSPFYRQIELRDKRFYREQLAPSGTVGAYPEFYWFNSDNNITIWPTPTTATAVTLNVDYFRHHGAITEETTIFIPRRWEMVLYHLAKQVYKGQIQSIDQNMDNDPNFKTMMTQMIVAEAPKDRTFRPSSREGYRLRLTHELT